MDITMFFLPKQHLPSVVRIEGKIIPFVARVWDYPNKKSDCESRADFASGYSLAVLATNLFLRKVG